MTETGHGGRWKGHRDRDLRGSEFESEARIELYAPDYL